MAADSAESQQQLIQFVIASAAAAATTSRGDKSRWAAASWWPFGENACLFMMTGDYYRPLTVYDIDGETDQMTENYRNWKNEKSKGKCDSVSISHSQHCNIEVRRSSPFHGRPRLRRRSRLSMLLNWASLLTSLWVTEHFVPQLSRSDDLWHPYLKISQTVTLFMGSMWTKFGLFATSRSWSKVSQRTNGQMDGRTD